MCIRDRIDVQHRVISAITVRAHEFQLRVNVKPTTERGIIKAGTEIVKPQQLTPERLILQLFTAKKVTIQVQVLVTVRQTERIIARRLIRHKRVTARVTQNPGASQMIPLRVIINETTR